MQLHSGERKAVGEGLCTGGGVCLMAYSCHPYGESYCNCKLCVCLGPVEHAIE